MCDISLHYSTDPPEIILLKKDDKENLFSDFESRYENIKERFEEKQFSKYNIFKYNPSKQLQQNGIGEKYFKQLIDDIKKEKEKENCQIGRLVLESSEIIRISYKEIEKIAHLLICYLENVNKMSNSKVIYQKIFPTDSRKCPMLPRLDKIKTLEAKTLEDLGEIKTIYLCLGPKNEKDQIKISKNIITLFTLFFKPLFRSLLELHYDLNIYHLNSLYKDRNNPYELTTETVNSRGKDYKTIFLSNFILLEALPIIQYQKIKVTMYDSYQREIHNIFSEEFLRATSPTEKQKGNTKVDRRINTTITNSSLNSSISSFPHAREQSFTIDNDVSMMSMKQSLKRDEMYTPSFTGQTSDELNNVLIYFYSLYFHNILKMEFAFNALDPLLFSNIIYLIYNKTFFNLTLTLFPKGKQCELRKILVNKNYYHHFYLGKMASDNPIYKTKDCYYDLDNSEKVLTSNDENRIWLLKKEKILKELFYHFNLNLFDLTVVLGKKLKDFSNLVLDLSFSSNSDLYLRKYDEYNCSLICFIFNLFQSIQGCTELKLNYLEIILDDPNDQNLHLINLLKNKFFKYKAGFKLLHTPITQINFSITHISELISFENYPCNSLITLILRNISEKDFSALIKAIDKNNELFKILTTLEISFDYMLEVPFKKIKHFIKKCILPKIENLTLDISQNIQTEEIFKILSWIRNHKKIQTKINFILKIKNDMLNNHSGQPSFNTYAFPWFKREYSQYNKKHCLCCQIRPESIKRIGITLEKLSKEKVKTYLSIIGAFEKKSKKDGLVLPKEKTNKKRIQKCYKKICYMMGNLEPSINVLLDTFS